MAGEGARVVTDNVMNSISNSRSYGAFVACEYNHTLGNESKSEAWAGINGLAILAIELGNVKAAAALIPAALLFDFGGEQATSRACTAQVYGPR